MKIASASGTRIVLADLKSNGGLANTGKHFLGRQNCGAQTRWNLSAGEIPAVELKTQSAHSGGGKNGGIEFRLRGEFLQAGADIAADGEEF